MLGLHTCSSKMALPIGLCSFAGAPTLSWPPTALEYIEFSWILHIRRQFLIAHLNDDKHAHDIVSSSILSQAYLFLHKAGNTKSRTPVVAVYTGPSGDLTVCYGRSTIFNGKNRDQWWFSIANLNHHGISDSWLYHISPEVIPSGDQTWLAGQEASILFEGFPASHVWWHQKVYHIISPCISDISRIPIISLLEPTFCF